MPGWLDWTLRLLGVLGGGSGVAAIIISGARLRAERAKLEAEASEIITQAAVALVKPLQEEIDRLKGRVKVLETALGAWQGGARLLGKQVRALGGEPVWSPSEVVHGESAQQRGL